MESRAVQDVVAERKRQRLVSTGGLNHDDFDRTNTRNDWVAYISAYAGRAADRVDRNEVCDFRDMMVKVAALAVAAIEAHDAGWCE